MKNFLIGLFIGLACVSCASVQYKVYVLKYRQGMLFAHLPKDDLPISVCDDTAQSKAMCYVVLKDEYAKMLRDAAEKDRLLQACEKKNP